MVDLKKLQKEIYQNKVNKGFNVTDINKDKHIKKRTNAIRRLTMKDDKKALVLFSGGKDSLIVTLRLLDSNYKVYLVTYENGCGLKTENVNNTIERLVKNMVLKK